MASGPRIPVRLIVWALCPGLGVWQCVYTAVDTVSRLTTGEMELFTPMDCEAVPQTIKFI